MVNIDPVKDLARIVAPPTQYQGMRFSQGTIISWNPDTFENQIAWRTITLTNVPVLSGPDALTYRPGDVVGLLGWQPGGGFGSWWILGRVIVPGPGAGQDAIDFLTSALGEAVSAEVFASRVKTDAVGASEVGAPDPPNFGDLPTVGPTVPDVEVTSGGIIIVFISARVDIPVAGFEQAFMSVQITGPATANPSFDRSLHLGISQDVGSSVSIRATSAQLFRNAPPGIYTVQAKYQGSSAEFRDRELVVMSF